MPWREYPYYDLSDGIHREAEVTDPDYPRGGLWELSNMVYERDRRTPEVMKGATLLGTAPTTSDISGLFDYDEGTRLIATAEDGKVYEYNGTAWSQATNGTGFSTTASVRWSGHMYYGATSVTDLLVLCNGVDAPQKYDSTNGVSALGGTPPSTGQFPTPFIGRLWMAQGSTLFYSAANNCEDFATLGGSIQVERGTGDIVSLWSFAGFLFILKRTAIYRMAPTDRLSETAIREVSTSVGTISHWTLREIQTDIGQALVFMAEDGVRALVPTNTSGGFFTPSISGAIKGLIDRRYTATTGTFWADYNMNRAEYWLQYGTSQAVPQEGLICNTARSWKKLRWTRHRIGNLTAGTTFRSSGAQIQVVGNSSGEVLQMQSGYDWNGSGYPARLFTAALNQGAPHYMKEYNRAFIDAESNGNYPVHVHLVVGRRDLPSPHVNIDALDLAGGGGWAVGEWGKEPWGGFGVAGQHIRFSKVGRGAFVRLLVQSFGPDHWYRLKGSVIEANVTSNSIDEA